MDRNTPQRCGAGGQGKCENGATVFAFNLDPAPHAGKNYSLVVDREAIRAALIYFRGSGPYRLHAVGEGVPFESSGPLYDVDAAAGWAVSRNAERRNVYLALADVAARVGKTKAKDTDVESVGWAWADLDPAKDGPAVPEQRPGLLAKLEGERLACLPAPSAILDSGGGYWGFWRLAEPLLPDAARRVLAGIADALESDRVFDPSRIVRLAGTVNWPDAAKQARGQVPALARLIFASEATVDAAALPVGDPKASKGASGPVTADPARDIDPATLPVLDTVRALIVQGRDPDDPDRWADRSALVFYVACALVRAGASDATMLGVLLDPDLGVSAHVREQPKAETYARRQVERARAAVAEDETASGKDTRPQVVWDEHRLPETLDAAEAALIAAGVQVYQSGGRIVQAVRLDHDEGEVKRKAGALLIRDVAPHRLRELMIGAADFRKWGRDKDGKLVLVPCAPPVSMAHSYAGRGQWRLPVLNGICECPTLREDGTVVSANGYDPASRLIVDTIGTAFPPVPEEPTRDDAVAALACLAEMLCDFPFETDTDRSVALAAMLTAVSRRAVPTAPMFGLTAPAFGTGKTLLADVCSWMVSGRDSAKMTQGGSDEEDEKRLLAILMAGDPVIVIDNIVRPVSGDALAAVLTSEYWQGRRLGASEMVRVSTQALMLANGNNLEFRDDMASRVLLCRLDAEVERPEERTGFRYDLRMEVPARRGALVAAALTVLRAWIVAGKPAPAELLRPGRFPVWESLVRGALVWAGRADPCGNRDAVRSRDSGAEELASLMLAWDSVYRAGGDVKAADLVTAADIVDKAYGYNGEVRHEGLAAALSLVCPNKVTPRSVGKYLARVVGRMNAGRSLRREPDPEGKGIARYWLNDKKPKPKPNPEPAKPPF